MRFEQILMLIIGTSAIKSQSINDYRSENRANSYIPLNKYPFLSSYPLPSLLPPNIYPNLPIPPGPSFPLPPSLNYPSQGLPFCLPFISPTHDICPDKFYFYDYVPLLYGSNNAQTKQQSFINIADYLTGKETSASDDSSTSTTTSTSTKGPPNVESNQVSLEGPVWQIFKQTYDKCCPLNRKSLKINQLEDEFTLYQRLFNSFGILNNSIQGQGMYGLIEYFNPFQQFENGPFNVQLFSSSGFYLINKRELNGASTITPIALKMLTNMWPLIVIILLANAYSAILIWLIDKTMSTNQFSHKCLQGILQGSWWSYILFSTNGFTPRVDLKKLVARIFAVIWMMVSLVIVIIFVAMFTTSLTVYGLNGQSLNKKTVGFIKYSSDRLWLDTESAVAVEYDNLNDIFKDLDDLKLDFMLIDQLYANFYSKLITERFYVMRFVPRKRTFNIALRGFHTEQVTCFQTLTAILSQQWIRSNLTQNDLKLTDSSKYFNVTDELLFPQRNAILIAALGLLAVIFIIGLSWQVACMNDPVGGRALSTGRQVLNRPARTVPRPRSLSADNPVSGAGGVGSNDQLRNIGRTLLNQNGLIGNGDMANTVIQGARNLLNFRGASPDDLPDELPSDKTSVKFNPLVHNVYYKTRQNMNDTFTQVEQPRKYYRVNENGFEEVNTFDNNFSKVIKIPSHATIQILTPPASRRNKSIQTKNDELGSQEPPGYQNLKFSTVPMKYTPDINEPIAHQNDINKQKLYSKPSKGIILKPCNAETSDDESSNNATTYPPLTVTVIHSPKSSSQIADDHFAQSQTEPMSSTHSKCTTLLTSELARNNSFYLSDSSHIKL